MSYDSITFMSGSSPCDAWHFPAANDSLTTAAGRPIVVMAHGLGGTKDSGLASFAEGLTAAGVDVFAFDYRGFGGSGIARRRSAATGAVGRFAVRRHSAGCRRRTR